MRGTWHLLLSFCPSFLFFFFFFFFFFSFGFVLKIFVFFIDVCRNFSQKRGKCISRRFSLVTQNSILNPAIWLHVPFQMSHCAQKFQMRRKKTWGRNNSEQYPRPGNDHDHDLNDSKCAAAELVENTGCFPLRPASRPIAFRCTSLCTTCTTTEPAYRNQHSFPPTEINQRFPRFFPEGILCLK